jgi:hypothetical protein
MQLVAVHELLPAKADIPHFTGGVEERDFVDIPSLSLPCFPSIGAMDRIATPFGSDITI